MGRTLDHRKPMDSGGHRPGLHIRYACAGFLAGLLLGLLEAGYLSRYPYPTVLLKPTVTYLIWFLAPLLDGTAAAFGGLAVGIVVATGQGNRTIRGIARFLCDHMAVSLTLLIAVVAENILMGGPYAFHALKVVVIVFLAVAVSRLIRPLELRTLGTILGSIFLAFLAGVGSYRAGPSFHATASAAGLDPPRGKPSIILITLDTVRADHVSSYGYWRPTTPNLDKWAREGVVFDNAIAPTSWTLASHASMFTGSLPHQHGADWRVPLNTSRWTLADVLKARGYETAGFTSNLAYGEAGWGLDEGFDIYEDNRVCLLHNLEATKLGMRVLDPLYQKCVWPDYFERRDASRLNQDVIAWVHHRSPHPFLLFINYFDVHDPYLPPHDFAHRFGDAPPKLIRRTQHAFTSSGEARISPQDRAALIAGYDNCLASLDESLGDLLDSLSRLPQWQNSVVIIASDHGEGFGEHGTYDHGLSLYREELHVPLIIFGPQVPKGIRIPSVVSTQDLFSTALEFSGEGNAPFSHTALQRYWTPGMSPDELNETPVAELTPKFGSTGQGPQMCLWSKDWEYIRDSQGREELYHWTQDPGEQINLARSSEYRSIVEALHARLCALIGESRHPWQRPQYLSALDEPRRPFVNVAATFAEPVSGQHVPLSHIGDVQDHFPPRPTVSSGILPQADRDLLQSLPYR